MISQALFKALDLLFVRTLEGRQMGRLRHRETVRLVQDPRAGKWQGRDLSSVPLAWLSVLTTAPPCPSILLMGASVSAYKMQM